ncbi:hypothetical protein EVAR_32322_1 [Eumeta japonica]|uniref:Uncharacterized protein n=1 Tax=Eumeta variegata TaxID=151549 RepID=A0A4C1Z7Z7_EUMVA|nr:hypothetical protein EVAR_32322_1 [Eumeta japonica]
MVCQWVSRIGFETINQHFNEHPVAGCSSGGAGVQAHCNNYSLTNDSPRRRALAPRDASSADSLIQDNCMVFVQVFMSCLYNTDRLVHKTARIPQFDIDLAAECSRQVRRIRSARLFGRVATVNP